MGFDTVNTMETPTLPRRQRVKKAVKEPREREEEDPGCLALLKKISCSLQCGGTTCSIKETEQVSASSLSASSCESLTSVEPKKPSARKRRASSKPPQAKDGVHVYSRATSSDYQLTLAHNPCSSSTATLQASQRGRQGAN